MKYKEWLHDWLDNYIKPSSKTKTCARYTEIVERHIIPHLGDVELDELSALVIQKKEESLTLGDFRSIIYSV